MVDCTPYMAGMHGRRKAGLASKYGMMLLNGAQCHQFRHPEQLGTATPDVPL